jgi:hypothetical protein
MDFEGPFILKKATGLFATRFAHAPSVVFLPCELTGVPRDFFPAVGDAQGRVGRWAEVKDVKEGPRRTSLHQRLLGFKGATKSNVQCPRRRARKGEEGLQRGLCQPDGHTL